MIFWGMAGRTWRRSGRQRKQAPAIAAASLMPRHTGFRGTQWNVARRPVMMFVLLLLLGAPCAAAVDYYGGPEVIRPLGEIYRTSLTAAAFAADPYILLENATLPTWLGYCLDPMNGTSPEDFGYYAYYPDYGLDDPFDDDARRLAFCDFV